MNTTITTNMLETKSYTYTYTSGMSGKVHFLNNKVTWEILEGPNKGLSDTNDYVAQLVQENIFFVKWHEPVPNITVTLLINENTKKVHGSIVTKEGQMFDIAEIHGL